MHGEKEANQAVANSDLILALGTRFSDRVVGDVKKFASKAKIIHVDIDKAEIDKNVTTDFHVIGDCRKVLEVLIPKVYNNDNREWIEKVNGWRKQVKTSMLGYYENQEATDEVLRNGWLHTGDLGYMDEEGFVYLTGRKKTVIVTKGGKNIFPEELETVLMEDEHIQEVLVHGVDDGRVGNVVVTADIYPNYKLLTSEKGKLSSSEIYHFYKELVEEINDKLPPNKRIKRISIRDEEFVKTTTGKIKRFGNNTEAAASQEKHPECSSEILTRSEERRVGKECRSRWSPYH